VTPDEPGCDIFVDAADDDAVLALLASRLGVESDLGFVSLPGFDVRVSRNPLVGPPGSDNFVDWPILVEVSARPDQDLTTFVADLVATLHAAGHRATPVY
jgi:hypothetical protein